MARKTKIVTISREGRDKGKKFLITEMSAFAAENWATRALLAIANASNDLPIDALSHIDPNDGFLAFAAIGYEALHGAKPDVAIPLWNELLSCVEYQEESGSRPILDQSEDIEEPLTIMQLKKEVFFLHVDFLKSVAGSPSQI